MKTICYYTDNTIDDNFANYVRGLLTETGLEIVSASLKPIDFGNNDVVAGPRGYATLVRQIVSCLSRAHGDKVFFCEHDVLYPKSHFDMVPFWKDVFYYNQNVWRWWWGSDKVVQYDRMIPLSVLCVNRDFALNHFKARLEMIEKNGWHLGSGGEPGWARKMGYEPGTKKKRRGGFSDDVFALFKSKDPVIDIRHKNTYSPPKFKLSQFKHPPKWFREEPIEFIEHWDLKEVYERIKPIDPQ